MNDIIRIIGSEIWISTHLFSQGLQGKEWAEKLREAEEIVRAVYNLLSGESGATIAQLESEIEDIQKDLDDANDENEELQVIIDGLRNELELAKSTCAEPPPQSTT